LKNRAKIHKKKQSSRSPLPKFLNWLTKKIDSGEKKFALDAQELILYKPSNHNSKLIFILPEVLDLYSRYSGITAKLIQSELKKTLMVTFAYTIIRDEKVIEVFPCQFFGST
jgi:hypothetical protein